MQQRIVRTAFAATIAVIVLLGTPVTSVFGAGLWPSSYVATGLGDRCLPQGADKSNFCFIDDNRPGVELGVRFTTSQRVLASGIRIYRIDSGAVTGSLWTSDGVLLASGSFASTAQTGWQDLVFSVPVLIEPNETYIASYFSPDATYAYEWEFFRNSPLTVGPITALQSVDGNGNGVYCYADDPSCESFPVYVFRDTNYWVSPLWIYAFDGFYQPVDNGGVWNKAKAGSAIPVKFSLDGDRGLNILRSGYPRVAPIACPSAADPTDTIEETVTAGSTSLTYDPYADRYLYVWKTNKLWAGKCYRFELGLIDDSERTFNVQFFK